MALIVDGMECLLCGLPLKAGQPLVSFSPFVSNELDRLWVFSDGAFHSECFHKHPLAKEAQARYEEMREQVGPGHNLCVVCERETLDPDDYFGMGHLVEDAGHPLHRYNYSQGHRSCLPKWEALPVVYQLLEELKLSGTWRGGGLELLLAQLRAALQPPPAK